VGQDSQREVEATADLAEKVVETAPVHHSKSNGLLGGSGESLAFLRLSRNFRSRSLPFWASACICWRNRSSRSADFVRSVSNAAPRSFAVRVGGGGSWAMTACSSGSIVSFPWQHGHTIRNEVAIASTLTAAAARVNRVPGRVALWAVSGDSARSFDDGGDIT